jgi:hypothetical protein
MGAEGDEGDVGAAGTAWDLPSTTPLGPHSDAGGLHPDGKNESIVGCNSGAVTLFLSIMATEKPA